MPASLLHAVVGETLVIVQSPRAIDDAEWDALMTRLRDGDHRGVLVVASPQAPNARQRNAARQAMSARTRPRTPVAVLADSIVVRTVVGILNMFLGDQVRMFPPGEVSRGLAHLEAAPTLEPEVRATIERLTQALG